MFTGHEQFLGGHSHYYRWELPGLWVLWNLVNIGVRLAAGVHQCQSTCDCPLSRCSCQAYAVLW
jgi:hypothetical protein